MTINWRQRWEQFLWSLLGMAAILALLLFWDAAQERRLHRHEHKVEDMVLRQQEILARMLAADLAAMDSRLRDGLALMTEPPEEAAP